MFKRIIIGFIMVSLLSVLGYFGYSYIKKDSQYVDSKEAEVTTPSYYSYLEVEKDGKYYKYNTEITNILLMGTDGSEGENISGQCDFVVLVSVDPENHKLNLFSLPRDTMCDVGVYDSDGNLVNTVFTHLALAYPYGGPSALSRNRACTKTVSSLLNDIPVDFYVTGGLDMLENLVDLVGECDITLDDDSLAFIDEKYVEGYVYHIDKDSIETYLRSRDHNDPDSPLKRQAREIKYLNYLAEIFLGTDSKNLNSYEEFLDKCQTNLTVTELLNIVDVLENLQTEDISAMVLPGEDTYDEEYVEYHVDEEIKNNLILESFYIVK